MLQTLEEVTVLSTGAKHDEHSTVQSWTDPSALEQLQLLITTGSPHRHSSHLYYPPLFTLVYIILLC